MTIRVVHRVPRIEEGVLLGPPSLSAGKAAAVPQSLPLLFDLEGFEAEPTAVDDVTDSATCTRQAVTRLLQPSLEEQTVHSAAVMALHAGGDSLEAVAQALARLGFSVKLASSAGGSLHTLKHTFITATRNTTVHGEPAEWIIDPSFAQAFAVASPTPRYAHIMAAVPSLLVAPLRRVMRVVLLLGAELARCFDKQDLPLPPWRHADAITSKYDAVSSVPVPAYGSSSSSDAVAAGASASPSGNAAPAVAAALAQRKLQRTQKQLERVQIQLARMGLLEQQTAAAAPSPASDDDGSSPRSVLVGASSRIVGFGAAKVPSDEYVCCGWRQSRFRVAKWQQPQQQRQQLGCQQQACSAAASAA
ncbi:hypothetical protein D9Q98_003435 [Chlorella vulgaris]|uniref:Uncharacterized protein n=1 Tax=Chlorella vulgaris TaxID=3077 RepID=A0A9D4TSM0_CHLVU|nr:hypothetical protein D9Q98_003435 [Chlorella vulgaris]